MKTRFRACLGSTSILFACATTPGTQPHDMSVAQHEAAVQNEERVGAGHQAQYHPNAEVSRNRCTGTLRPTAACWTSVANPTETHRRETDERHKYAAEHRTASVALRDAEARACVDISPDDRDANPFEHTEDIASVEPLTERTVGSKSGTTFRQVGAIVTFRSVPGMTAEWLQRVVDCHLARNGALGHEVPEMPNCPLVPRGAEARVSSTGNGFAVAIRASDSDAAHEILARAQRLIPRPSGSIPRSIQRRPA